MTKEVHLYASQRVSRRAKDGKDGTSVTIISKSVTYQISASGTETPTGNWSDKVVATTDTKPYLWTRTIVVYSDTNSTTSYSVSYKGKDGAPGKDAYRVEVSPSTLVFDTNEDGVVDRSALSGKYATVTVYKGSQKISVDNLSLPSNYATKKYTNVDGRIYNTNGEARITITEIEQETISGDEKVSKSSGQISFPIDVFGERSTLMWVTVNVQINVAKFTGSVVANNKKFETNFTEISERFKNTPTNDDLTKAESRITQTAREISLSVSEKVIGRRNLLVNSAFRNQDSVLIHSLARIEKNTGVDGVNCIHSSDKYSGTGEGNYIGAFWDSTQKNGVVTNIPIVKGKKYVFSCWIKSDNLDLPFIIECLYMKSINQQSRDNVDGAISVAFKVHEKNKWEKISCVLDTNNEKATEYLAVNFWSNNKNVPRVTDITGATYYPTCHAYICKPMMEEGDTYSGWTLSEDDYDYVGGNILDNTRSLEKSGNLKTEDSEIINEGYEYAYAVAHSNNTTSAYIEMLQWNMVGRINDRQDYIFSFLAKGTGVVSTYLWKDGTPRFFVESSNNKHDAVSPDGNVDFKLTNEWKRYWVHYHLNTSSEHPLPENLLIRCYSGNDVYVCQPKLEVGATMTEFTERKTDLVDKASLKKAGIEITSEQVTLYGNKVQVKTPKANPSEGYDEAAMFQNGKLNANLIDAKNIVTQGLRTGDIDAERATIKNLSIIGSSRNPFTRMSEGTNVDYSNNVSVITNINHEFVTSNYELKWDNSQNGRRITLLNYRWRNEFADGGATINAPEGKYFFEDGLKKSALKFSRQYVELLGIGDDIAFYGWVVVNKVDVSSVFGYGHVAKVLAYGSLVATIENNKLKLTLSQKTFDGNKITVEQDAIGYKLRFPSSWGNAANFVPNITPYKFIGNIYIYERGYDYIIIRYSGKSSENRNWEDASFLFSIQTAADFEWLNKET
jgi:hypothetical protein